VVHCNWTHVSVPHKCHQQATVRHFTPFSIQMPNTQVVSAPGSEGLKL